MTKTYSSGLVAVVLAITPWHAFGQAARGASPNPQDSSSAQHVSSPGFMGGPVQRSNDGIPSPSVVDQHPVQSVPPSPGTIERHTPGPAPVIRADVGRPGVMGTAVQRTAPPTIRNESVEHSAKITGSPVQNGNMAADARVDTKKDHDRGDHHSHDVTTTREKNQRPKIVVVANWYTWPPYCYYDGDSAQVYYGSPPGNSSPSPTARYYDYGYGWGSALKLGKASWEDFVYYLKTEIVDAGPMAVDKFQHGFVAGYGVNGPLAFNSAMNSASS